MRVRFGILIWKRCVEIDQQRNPGLHWPGLVARRVGGVVVDLTRIQDGRARGGCEVTVGCRVAC